MKKILIITNIVSVILLVGIFGACKSTQKNSKRSAPVVTDQLPPQPYSFLDNPGYKEITGFYSVYTGQKNIVMLGNSLTYRINWAELMGRDDIANRGIGSDITAGFINRLNFVLNVKPRICFIEGGVNDLARNINNETIINNLSSIADTLIRNHIQPVLLTVTYVAKHYNNAINFNHKIKALNQQIIQLASSRQITWINLNLQLTDGNFLLPEFTIEDGIHFTGKAYQIWKEAIIKILENEKI